MGRAFATGDTLHTTHIDPRSHMRDVDRKRRRTGPATSQRPSGAGSSRRVGALLRGPSDGADGARWLRRGASALGTAALVVAAAAASHYGGEFSDMPALGLGAPVPSVIAKLGRRNDRVLLAPMQHLAYCNLPKAASSTVTYMTGLNVNIHKFSDVQFIVERGGDRTSPWCGTAPSTTPGWSTGATAARLRTGTSPSFVTQVRPRFSTPIVPPEPNRSPDSTTAHRNPP